MFEAAARWVNAQAAYQEALNEWIWAERCGFTLFGALFITAGVLTLIGVVVVAIKEMHDE